MKKKARWKALSGGAVSRWGRGRQDSHGDGEDVACGGDRHAGAVHHLLTVAVQHALVRAPGHGQREGDVHLLVCLAA